MLGVDRILVALSQDEAHQDNDGALGDASHQQILEGNTVVLEKAVALANAADASLEVINVTYSPMADMPVKAIEQNHALKTYVLQAAESWLEDQLDGIRNQVKSLAAATLWNKDEWQGILHAAEAGNADLIIKATHVAPSAGLSMRTPQDWNLLRHATIPVMLVKPDAWVENPIIMAAIDVLNDSQFELNKRVLREADSLTSILGGELAIVSSYPMMAPWGGPAAVGVDFEQLRTDIEHFARHELERLTRAAEVNYNYLYLEEGRPAMRVRALVEETNAEMLVMGTMGRTGIKSLVIGNTAETILHYTHCDAVVLRDIEAASTPPG
ncbi:MAG: universal stress protein E [Candidatus Azotimanducaceae bacterium]|jgi:universal stress protein E